MRNVDPPTLAALLELLRDESPSVANAAREKLRSLGAAGEEALAQAAESDDARLRVRARAALFDLRQGAAVRAICDLASRADAGLDLEECAFAMAQVEYPDLDRTPYLSILDSLGEQLAERVGTRTPASGRAAELSRLLSNDWRLRMNHEHFDDPDKRVIHRALDRRRGLPITLATIYLCVSRRAGLPAYGIGAPGHFLLRYGPAELDIYIDPATGRRMRLEDCAKLLEMRGIPAAREQFEPATARETAFRMCSNLINAYEKRRARAHVERWTKLREAFRASDPAGGLI